MIRVSRLSGEPFGLNADLIERVEETPDTVLTLIDGKKLLIGESLADVIERVIDFRAAVLARVPTASRTTQDPEESGELEPVLHLVVDEGVEGEPTVDEPIGDHPIVDQALAGDQVAPAAEEDS